MNHHINLGSQAREEERKKEEEERRKERDTN